MNNVTLGLLAALVIIIASNMFFHEGLDNMMPETTTTNTVASNISDVVANAKEKIQAKINENNSVPVEESDGVDLETIKASVQPKSSSTLPVSLPGSSEHVSPASTEPFTSMYAPF
jgi:biopolymer transport protein ExbD